MKADFKVYINDYYFDTLWNAQYYNDRPEPYRMHEKSLWTIYQLLKLEKNLVTLIHEKDIDSNELKFENNLEFIKWVKLTYPAFVDQLDNPIYTRFPHPKDSRK